MQMEIGNLVDYYFEGMKKRIVHLYVLIVILKMN